jgi:hypothetical protein
LQIEIGLFSVKADFAERMHGQTLMRLAMALVAMEFEEYTDRS